ncbi:hypothetical protein DERF_009923, partial [Dermatophagoides farinae]
MTFSYPFKYTKIGILQENGKRKVNPNGVLVGTDGTIAIILWYSNVEYRAPILSRLLLFSTHIKLMLKRVCSNPNVLFELRISTI